MSATFDDPRLPPRFWSKVIPEPNTGCWLWLGGRNNQDGYGSYGVSARRSQVAHKACYEILIGPVPGGLELDHRCRVRCCVNPDHLEPVTHRVNVMRGAGMAARNAAAINCPVGHPYDDGSRTARNGWRVCKICETLRARARSDARKEARRILRIAVGDVCRRGHPFTPDTTIINVRGGISSRECRVCKYARTRFYRSRSA
jgi:HNH endonuclease